MGTRALFTFKDNHAQRFHIYKHYAGDLYGALNALRAMKDLIWALQRFEADEAAAGFVAGAKKQPGGVRLLPTGTWKKVAPSDIEFRYEISPVSRSDRDVYVNCYSVDLVDAEWREKHILKIEIAEVFAMSDDDVETLADRLEDAA